MKINCLIIDDEPLAINILERYISEVPYMHTVGSFDNPLEALRFLQRESVDLIFLDIHMPELSGIKLAKALPEPPLLIFTTAYPEYAVEGFELDATDYLVKPFSRERFLKAVQKAGKQLGQEQPSHADPGFLTLKADRKIFRIAHEDILFAQAYGDYVKLQTSSQQLTPKITLARLLQQLPQEQFLRVHRSYLIAWQKVSYMEGNQLKIGETLIPVGQQYREAVLQRFSS